jgi:hypothetical protein
MDTSGYLPIPKARWDGEERKAIVLPKSEFGTLPAPALLFFPFGSGIAARRVGSTLQSSLLSLSTIGRLHLCSWAQSHQGGHRLRCCTPVTDMLLA